MKTKLYFAPRTTRYALVVALLSTFTTFYVAQPSTAFAQGTAFTYQGRLQNNGSPANGLYDLKFIVWDAPTNGNLVAGPLTNSATGASNGLFTVTLDFGSGVFTGPARWLELDVRTNGSGAFTTLLPRQQLLPTPYAIMANSASNLLGTLPAAQLSGTIPATNLTGTVSLAQLPAAVLTNNSTSIILSGTFSGNGAGLTGVPGSVSWQNVTGTSQQAQPNTGYLANNAAQVTITLPTAPNLGDIVLVSGVGAGGWMIAQNAGQCIQAGQFGAWYTNWNSLMTNWTASGPYGGGIWYTIACSADGMKLATAVYSYTAGIYTSTNFGGTWTLTSAPVDTNWYCIASSADGNKLVAVIHGGGIFTSTNSGGTWTQTSAISTNWSCIASSADGTKLVATADGLGASGGGIFISTNSGLTWTQTSAPNTNWVAIASSADGTKLAAIAETSMTIGGGIFTSTNSGLIWTQTSAPTTNWMAIASSADGTKLAAVAGLANNGQVYLSANSGVTWTQTSAPIIPEQGLRCIVSSADGTRLAAGAFEGPIWTADAPIQSTTTPGTAGYMSGGQYSALELQYIGNGQFMPLSYVGTISAY